MAARRRKTAPEDVAPQAPKAREHALGDLVHYRDPVASARGHDEAGALRPALVLARHGDRYDLVVFCYPVEAGGSGHTKLEPEVEPQEEGGELAPGRFRSLG